MWGRSSAWGRAKSIYRVDVQGVLHRAGERLGLILKALSLNSTVWSHPCFPAPFPGQESREICIVHSVGSWEQFFLWVVVFRKCPALPLSDCYRPPLMGLGAWIHRHCLIQLAFIGMRWVVVRKQDGWWLCNCAGKFCLGEGTEGKTWGQKKMSPIEGIPLTFEGNYQGADTSHVFLTHCPVFRQHPTLVSSCL